MKKYIIIVAGGKGKRFGANIPKQFIPINGKPILMHTIERFYSYDANMNIIVVVSKTHMEYWKVLCLDYKFNIPHIIVQGGEERYFSVKNALEYVPSDALVGIHDAVRPFVSVNLIKKAYVLAEEKQSVAPAIKPTDSVRYLFDEDKTSKPIDREKVYLIQTPQCFHSGVLKNAYQGLYNKDLTDDISIVEDLFQLSPTLFDGEKENIKITTPGDIAFSQHLSINNN